MKILALDAATQAMSVAIADGRRLQAAQEHFEIAPRGHAARLLPLAQRLLAEAGWQLGDLDGLAFGRGPGAFTGLRIAAGFIQGLSYGADLPVAPISTLRALASRALQRHAGNAVRVVQDARMGEIYTADFRRADDRAQQVGSERIITPATLTTPDEGLEWLFAGNGWPVVVEANALAPAPEVCEQWPHALDIAALGQAVLERGDGVPACRALPVYVRDDVARKPRQEC